MPSSLMRIPRRASRAKEGILAPTGFQILITQVSPSPQGVPIRRHTEDSAPRVLASRDRSCPGEEGPECGAECFQGRRAGEDGTRKESGRLAPPGSRAEEPVRSSAAGSHRIARLRVFQATPESKNILILIIHT
ncbi:Hypothetical protein NTJ_07885 [Nesidiocoris tenuis]|uniref:Uncharacterized protein n=1 Tax=Nesidiocoris tenuis TaxID=355587 RepID=A0ABN7ASA0_9HEMI|nr:Hypothetical protein NTJ_07885 [Nesidiocoris tenuis]